MDIIKDATQPVQPTTTALRLEERRITDSGETRTAILTTWDRQPLNQHTGWEALVRSQRQHPGRYTPTGGYRLVLVGGDR